MRISVPYWCSLRQSWVGAAGAGRPTKPRPCAWWPRNGPTMLLRRRIAQSLARIGSSGSGRRARAEQARRDWRLNAPLRTIVPDPPEKIATERLLSDDTLQPGDIVSTTKGYLLFRGRSGADGQAADVVPIVPRWALNRIWCSAMPAPCEFLPSEIECFGQIAAR